MMKQRFMRKKRLDKEKKIYLWIIFYVLYRKYKNMLYIKISFLMSTTLVFIATISMIQSGSSNNSIISAFILYPIGISVVILLTNYTMKIIVKTNENLVDVIKESSTAAVNVSNMATELAASASEVNSSSEEITSTTIELTKVTQDIVESSIEIKILFQIKQIY